jgi:hypothetical protein
MKYKIGDKIPNGDAMLRRIRLKWINSDRTFTNEAFRPRMIETGFEDGVSVDLEMQLAQPVGNDYWSNERKMATGQFLSDVVNGLPPYEIIYDGRSPSHCIIAGDMSVLYNDEKVLAVLAKNTVLIHTPIS